MPTVPPTVYDEFKRSHLLLLVLGAIFMPLFGVLDWAVARETAAVCVGIRLGFSVAAVLLYLVGRRLPARRHPALAWASVSCVALAACAVTTLSGSLILLVVFSICIPPLVSSFLPLPRRHAFLLLGMLQAVGCLLPAALFFLQGVREVLLLSGLFAGAAILVLGTISSGRAFALRCVAAADLEAMERQRASLARLSARAQRRGREVESALGNITRLVGRLRENITALEAEAQALSASAQEMSVVIKETVSQSDSVAEALVAIDAAGQQGRASIEAFGAWEAQAARPARSRLRDDARQMAEAISEMGRVLEVVGSIARESRILALNAGIEAARASVGKFQQIAGQMLHFSDGVRERSAKMGERVDGLAKASAGVEVSLERFAQASDRASARLGSGLQTTREVSEKLGQVREAVQTLTGAAEQQAASVALLTQSSAGLQGSVEGIHALVQGLERTASMLAASAGEPTAVESPSRAA